jgi:hypothetical protein
MREGRGATQSLAADDALEKKNEGWEKKGKKLSKTFSWNVHDEEFFQTPRNLHGFSEQ